MKIIRYTSLEDSTISECVKDNPNNLARAFDIAASKLKGRTNQGISFRYYNVLRHKSPLIAIGSPKTVLVNTKNTLRTKPSSLYNAKMRTDMLKSAFLCISKDKIIDFFIERMSKEEQGVILTKIVNRINTEK